MKYSRIQVNVSHYVDACQHYTISGFILAAQIKLLFHKKNVRYNFEIISFLTVYNIIFNTFSQKQLAVGKQRDKVERLSK